ncbi:MAG: hypothetical protein WDN04_09150 [Rhodospirillales bacterium]
MNGITYTIAQALASQLSNLQVVDSASNIAAALPNSGLSARVAGFSLSGNGSLTAALADRLALLGGKYHAAGYQLTVSDTLAAMISAANAGGLALAAARQVVDAAYNLLVAPASSFAHVTSVVLIGNPALSISQLAKLEAMPQFSIGAGAHVTLADSLTNISATLASHPAWLASVSAMTVRLDGSHIGAYAASQLAGLAGHGKILTFLPSIGDTALQVTAARARPRQQRGGAQPAVRQHPARHHAQQRPHLGQCRRRAALTGLIGFSPAAHTLFVADSGANIASHAARLFGHGFTEIIVTSGVFGGTSAQLLDSALHISAGTSALLTQSAVLGADAVAALALLRGFSRAGGVTLTVADSTANLLANASHLAAATEVQVTDSATVQRRRRGRAGPAGAGAPERLQPRRPHADGGRQRRQSARPAGRCAGPRGRHATDLERSAHRAAGTASIVGPELHDRRPSRHDRRHRRQPADPADRGSRSRAGHATERRRAHLHRRCQRSWPPAPGFTTGGHALTIAGDVASLLALPLGLQIQASALVLGAAQGVTAAQLTSLLGLGTKFSEASHLVTVSDNAGALAGLSAPALALAGAAVLTQSAVVSGAAAGTAGVAARVFRGRRRGADGAGQRRQSAGAGAADADGGGPGSAAARRRDADRRAGRGPRGTGPFFRRRRTHNGGRHARRPERTAPIWRGAASRT